MQVGCIVSLVIVNGCNVNVRFTLNAGFVQTIRLL